MGLFISNRAKAVRSPLPKILKIIYVKAPSETLTKIPDLFFLVAPNRFCGPLKFGGKTRIFQFLKKGSNLMLNILRSIKAGTITKNLHDSMKSIL